MKHVILLLLIFCFQLSGGPASAQATQVTAHTCLDKANNQKLQTKAGASHQKAKFQTSITTETPNLFLLEDEDEDENEVLLKKQISTFTNLLNSYYRKANDFKLSSLKSLSYSSTCKYIVHRTLRI